MAGKLKSTSMEELNYLLDRESLCADLFCLGLEFFLLPLLVLLDLLFFPSGLNDSSLFYIELM